ncbi:dCTP deaminase [Burkholderia gladioli]|uniref:dCTP deaminase n=1 Tax=Burkholderia gladioli TaxID=28095 RepID=UPI00163FDA78|nr:deoxycytidine deaminase [Burkholderia gladioli]
MLVVSENLSGIVKSFGICRPELVEEFSIKIELGAVVRRMRDIPISDEPVRYESNYDPDKYFEDERKLAGDLLLKPGQNVLACSRDKYHMPCGYFGLVQTKGSLARLFVTATSNDGQVEPGYHGAITLELSNQATFSVAISPGHNIAQLFVFRCTSDAAHPYNGRYQGASAPTLALF